MAKRRTKAQKIKARARQMSYEFKSEEVETKNDLKKKSVKKKIKTVAVESGSETRLIKKDLLKTVWVSVILIGLLVGAYLYLN